MKVRDFPIDRDGPQAFKPAAVLCMYVQRARPCYRGHAKLQLTPPPVSRAERCGYRLVFNGLCALVRFSNDLGREA